MNIKDWLSAVLLSLLLQLVLLDLADDRVAALDSVVRKSIEFGCVAK